MQQPGDRIGRYEIQAVVGEGGFGKVYRAWDPELERTVAIKELSSARRTDEPAQYTDYQERFRLERRVQGQFQHPHIVSVYDQVQQDGNEYLVEEFVGGGTLRDLLRREGRLPPERVVEIGLEVCQAIATAWEQDIVHRDIKPSNILLSEDGHAKLTDFGVAQIGQMSQRTQTDTHHPGTPAYMSPEQESGGGYLDERSDLYALGLVLYEALTAKSFKRERVPVRQLVPGVPKRLEGVVMCALAQDRADRYQSAVEFETALRGSLDNSRPEWLWQSAGVILLVVLVLILAGGMSAGGWLQNGGERGALPVLTTTLPPSQTPTVTRTPERPTPTASRQLLTLTFTSTPDVTPTTQRLPSRTPVVTPSAPQLVSPPGAASVTSSHLVLSWKGQLPDSRYGFYVSLRNEERGLVYTSPALGDKLWVTDIPGGATGEWRWSVTIAHRDRAQDIVARSEEWTFYYNPFGSSSPLSTPAP